MLLRTQDFLATKYHGKQVPECPSIAGGARDKCAGEGAERMPCLGKVNSAVLLTHEQRCGTSTAAAATQKLGGDGLKLYLMQDPLLPTLLVSKSEIPGFNGLIIQVWGLYTMSFIRGLPAAQLAGHRRSALLKSSPVISDLNTQEKRSTQDV